MLLSLRKNGLTSLFKEVRVFKVCPQPSNLCFLGKRQGKPPKKEGFFSSQIQRGTLKIYLWKNPHANKNKIGTSTPPSKQTQNPPPPPPLKGGILWAYGGFSSRKNQEMPGAHKIGAAISDPRIAGGNFMDITFFLIPIFETLIDLLMGLFRGAVFHHEEGTENCPLVLMGRFPSFMGRFPTLMGRFPECLNGPFSLLNENSVENSPLIKGALRVAWNPYRTPDPQSPKTPRQQKKIQNLNFNQGRPKHNHNHNFPKKFCIWCHTKTALDGISDEISLWFLCVPLCRRGIWCVIRGYPKNEKWGSMRWTQKWSWLCLGCPLFKSEPILGKGMRRSTFQWKKGLSVWKGGRQFSESGVW